MASKRQRNRALKRKRHEIDPGELHPRLRAGLTQGASAEEAQAELGPVVARDGVDIVRYLREEKRVEGTRIPTPRFIGTSADTGFVRQRADGSRMGDAVLAFPWEVVRAMQAGMICMRCLEPQPFAFADEHLEGCEGVLLAGPHYMKDRQVADFAMEFEGEKLIGPSKPMSEYLEEQDARVERAAFDKKILEGKSRGRHAKTN